MVQVRVRNSGVALVVAAGLIAGGCSSSSSSSSTLACPSKHGRAVAGTAPAAPAATGRPAAGWTLPGADLANTRYVASAITSADVSTLGVAWTVPLTIPTTRTDGAYATTPVIVNGVVYVQDLESNVMAIGLATGKVLWTHEYNSPNGGPDGVNVVGGVVYAATAKAAVALDAATGEQLWSRTLIRNDHEGIAMAPGYNHGTVYVSTIPANVAGQYLPGGEGILWALNARTGAPEWSWDSVQNLWGNPGVNSGGELDAQTGTLLWQRPVGGHDGHEHDGLLTEHATPASRGLLPAEYCLEPSLYGGIVTQLASNGSTTFAAVNDLALPATPVDYTGSATGVFEAIENATGEMVAVNQDTGTVEWDTPLPSSPYGAATVTNDVVLTTTFKGYLYALDAATGAILFKTPMSAGSNAPVAVDGGYVIAGAGAALSSTQRDMIIAYKLGATGQLPDTVSS
ncbi:MAG: PQQ-binding-like beta-propeller repeat protein [Streptosporangiaceae bacterium]